jgi:ssDNA-binding Zn-finger/Zn-ribbon topoisomerase 1
MKPIIHAIGVSCNHLHVKETFDLRQVTCKACKHFLITDKEIEKKFYENEAAVKKETEQKMADLTNSIIIRKKTPDEIVFITPKCPKCLIPMIVRTNKHTNRFFYGCVKFPQCRQTEKFIKIISK